MKYLWGFIDRRSWRIETKLLAAFLILGVILSAVGFVLWLILRSFVFNSVGWMICFIGWPFVIAFFAVFIYYFNHSNKEG